METSLVCAVSQKSFFDCLATSVQYEVNEYTKKNLAVDKLHAGIKYVKELKDSKGKVLGSTNVEITKWEYPEYYQATFLTNRGTTVLGYKVTALSENECEVTYEESFDSPSVFNRLNNSLVGFLFKNKNKRRIHAIIRGIEQYCINQEGEKNV